uniref:Uncharacterized protein n=1 Tax=Strigamia maritima TaxID=126957 RepID=T1IHB0_STRMM
MTGKIISILFLLITVVNCSPLKDESRRKRAEPVVIVDTPSKDTRTIGFPFRFSFDDDTGTDDEDFLRPIGFRPFGGSFGNFGNSEMGNFWNRFQEMMDQMRRRIYGTVNTDLEELPPNYHNTTYETKNVNGSIVTVNQTIDKQTTNNSHSYFHIKVVQVKPEKPVEETTGTNSTPSPPRSTPEVVVPKVIPEQVPDEDTEDKIVDTPPEVAKKDNAPAMEENEP